MPNPVMSYVDKGFLHLAQDIKWRFSVRNAYHVKKDLQAIRRSGRFRKDDENLFSNLKIPNASKMFMWRACTDLLPTKKNLLRRGTVPDALCPICTREGEIFQHTR